MLLIKNVVVLGLITCLVDSFYQIERYLNQKPGNPNTVRQAQYFKWLYFLSNCYFQREDLSIRLVRSWRWLYYIPPYLQNLLNCNRLWYRCWMYLRNLPLLRDRDFNQSVCAQYFHHPLHVFLLFFYEHLSQFNVKWAKLIWWYYESNDAASTYLKHNCISKCRRIKGCIWE